MSRYDYQRARRLVADDEPFYGLVMAAMMRADDENLAMLRAAWPMVWAEMLARREAPDGVLAGE